ncbi:MAG TPA: alpha-amylase family glycosyl hydrolase, partial [Bacteroidales bacterium]|nr:alpha-amylase family glycosyl hydrolase [Bacteroidales bacterium]
MEKYTGPVWPGKPYPLGANYDGKGVNFALFSENAMGVKLCLFRGPGDKKEYTQIPLRENTDHVWHLYLPGIKPGQAYGYRVFGKYRPAEGLRFNSQKLMIDPYAKAICGPTNITEKMFGYVPDGKVKKPDVRKDSRDSADEMNKCIVVDNRFDWEGVERPDTQMHNSIIYELHVKGFTARHPDIPKHERGTYKALSSQPVIDYFKKLGVTAVELMPVHHFVHNKFLLDNGLVNYWGYNSIGYFAPHAQYSVAGDCGGQVQEFKEMVKTFHKNDIEVILDVVYNHTGEGDQLGPTLCFRGIDNENYYRLDSKNPRYYVDYTGTGNTLNL